MLVVFWRFFIVFSAVKLLCSICRCSRMMALHWEWSVARVWLIIRSASASVRRVRWSLPTTTTTSIWRCSVPAASWWERWRAPWNTTSATTSRSLTMERWSSPAKTTTCSSTSTPPVGRHQMSRCHSRNTTFKPDLPGLCQQLASANGTSEWVLMGPDFHMQLNDGTLTTEWQQMLTNDVLINVKLVFEYQSWCFCSRKQYRLQWLIC